MKDIRENKKYGVQCAYILDCIDDPEDVSGKEMTDKEKIDFFFTCFKDEYNIPNNIRLYPNLQDRIANYLQGLPSCCHMAYMDYQIIEIGTSWGFCETAKQKSDFVYNWFRVLGLRIIQIANHFKMIDYQGNLIDYEK